jgi:hypothetical protein
VQADLLNADEVLRVRVSSISEEGSRKVGTWTYVALRDRRRQRRRQLHRVLVREREGVERCAPLSNLEPLRSGAIPGRGRLAAWHLANYMSHNSLVDDIKLGKESMLTVDRGGAGVVDGVVELEADGRAGSDEGGGGGGGVDVAGHAGRGDGGDRAVVNRLPDGGGRGGAAGDERRPDVYRVKVSTGATEKEQKMHEQWAETLWARTTNAARVASFIVSGGAGVCVERRYRLKVYEAFSYTFRVKPSAAISLPRLQRDGLHHIDQR